MIASDMSMYIEVGSFGRMANSVWAAPDEKRKAWRIFLNRDYEAINDVINKADGKRGIASPLFYLAVSGITDYLAANRLQSQKLIDGNAPRDRSSIFDLLMVAFSKKLKDQVYE